MAGYVTAMALRSNTPVVEAPQTVSTLAAGYASPMASELHWWNTVC